MTTFINEISEKALFSGFNFNFVLPEYNSLDLILFYSNLVDKMNIMYLPEFFLFSILLIFLIYSIFWRLKYSYKVLNMILNIYLIILLGLIFINIFFTSDVFNYSKLIFNHGLLLNYFTSYLRLFIVLFTLIFFIISLYFFYSTTDKKKDFVEYPILIAFAVFFLLTFISSFDLMVTYLTLEGLSILLYILAAYPFKQSSVEASIKYYSLGALSSGILLFGISLIYGLTGALDFLNVKFFLSFNSNISYLTLNLIILCLIFGFLFKISAFPCHMWAPDVYEGTWLPNTVFFMTVVKMTFYFFFVRFIIYIFYNVFFICQNILLISVFGSLIVGTFGSLYQSSIKRLLSYTSVSQVGFALMGLACGTIEGISSSIFFFSVYIIGSIGIFIILLNTSNNNGNLRYISDFTNFNRINKITSLILTILILSMAGIPPLAGFFGKLVIFLAAMGSHLYLFTLVAIVLSTINAFVYFRMIKTLWSDHVLEHSDVDSQFEIFNTLYLVKTPLHIFYINIVYGLLIAITFFVSFFIFILSEYMIWCNNLTLSIILLSNGVNLI